MSGAYDWALRLYRAKGWDAGTHPEHGTVLYLYERIWRVAGGDPVAPSLIGLAGVSLNEVRWVTVRDRKEPVT